MTQDLYICKALEQSLHNNAIIKSPGSHSVALGKQVLPRETKTV